MFDSLGKVVRVGDVVSISSFDNGSTLRVIGIFNDEVLIVKKCYRGRKNFSIRFPKNCFCDFRIVNR